MFQSLSLLREAHIERGCPEKRSPNFNLVFLLHNKNTAGRKVTSSVWRSLNLYLIRKLIRGFALPHTNNVSQL